MTADNEFLCSKCGVELTIVTCFAIGPDGQPECPAGGWHGLKVVVHDPAAAERFLATIHDETAP